MKYALAVIVSVCALFLLGLTRKQSPPPQPDFAPVGERHHGVSWVGSRRPAVEDAHFQALLKYHVTHIVQTPFGWQSRYDDPNLTLNTSGGYWGEADAGLRATTAQAQRFGIKTLLKPHIWLRRSDDGKWRSEIGFQTEEDWATWFAAYRRFILHYAALAQELNIQGLCIGAELRGTLVREREWRALIKDIRAVYSGQLTYAANWYKEFEEVPFWDQLDYLGVQAYFPLTHKQQPTLDDLKTGWAPHQQQLEALVRKHRKPLVFTEVGYRNSQGAAVEPWLWPKQGRRRQPVDGEPPVILDPHAQALAYQALFETFWDAPYFKGMYVWKWFPELTPLDGKPADPMDWETFSPQHQPAMELIGRWYRSKQPADPGADSGR